MICLSDTSAIGPAFTFISDSRSLTADGDSLPGGGILQLDSTNKER